MYMSREVFRCHPGKAKEIVKIFKDVTPAFKQYGLSDLRIYTDVSGENYWTVIVEQDVESIDSLAEISRQTMSDPKIAGKFDGYHQYVAEGRREIYKREA